MRVDWSDLAGVSLEPGHRARDERGTFEKLYAGTGDRALIATQVCTSFNRSRGTLRGLHVQLPPDQEHKAIWCGAGELFDVLVDTRADQGTFGSWAGVHLTAAEPQLLRVPPGIAHGYQTLADGTVVNYLIDGTYAPDSARTIRWDDASLGIDWPLAVAVISGADRDGLPWPVS